MTETELHEQRIKAKAFWRIAQQRFENGLALEEEVNEAERRYKAMSVTKAMAEPTSTTQIEITSDAITTDVPKEVMEFVEVLRQEQAAIHFKKAQLSNSLHTFPDSLNIKATVDEIIRLRTAWKVKGDEIRSVLSAGVIPSSAEPVFDEEEYQSKLPRDADALRHKIQDLQSNIKKAEKRMAQAKEATTQQRNEIKIAQWRREIEQMKLFLSVV